MPCVGLVLAAVFLYWGSRFLLGVIGDSLGGGSKERVDPKGVGGAAVLTFSMWFWAPVAALGSSLALPAMAALPVLLLAVLLLVPAAVARWVAVPMGWPRLAFLLTRASTFSWRADRLGGAYAMGMWAWRRSARKQSVRTWLAARVASHPVTPGVVFGWALGREADGDDQLARRLVRLLACFDPAVVPDPLLPLATEFAVGCALEAGEREEALAWLEGDAPRTSATRVLDALLRGSDDQQLRRAVSLAPRTWEHLERWNQRERPRRHPLTPAAGTPLEQAMSLHLALLRAERPDPLHLVTVARAWDDALTEADTVLRQQVVTDLSQWVQTLDGRATGVLAEAAALARGRLQAELELSCDQLRGRVLAGDLLPAESELLSVVAIAAQFEAVSTLCSGAQRRVAWSTVNRSLTPLTVRMFNETNDKPLSNAITRWLLTWARRVDDDRATELHASNLACFRP